MDIIQTSEGIKKAAMIFDKAISGKDYEGMLSAFADDCEIELLGVTLSGKEGVQRWIDWLFMYISEIEFEPITILVEGNVFFEEFIVHGKLEDGRSVSSKQAEVLIYEDYKIKSLRLYFDRLDFAEAVADGFISRRIVESLIKRTREGLV